MEDVRDGSGRDPYYRYTYERVWSTVIWWWVPVGSDDGQKYLFQNDFVLIRGNKCINGDVSTSTQ